MRAIAVFAYIDPGTGAILLQAVVAGLVGAVAFFRKSIWRTVRRLTGRGAEPAAKRDEKD